MGEKPYHHGDLKNALVEAGIEIIRKQGIQGLSLRAVVRTLGVSHAAPYRHIRNKEELVIAIALRGFDLLKQKLEAAAAGHSGPPGKKLKTLGKTYLDFAAGNPDYYRVMFGPFIENKMGHADLAAAYDGCFGILMETLRDIQGKDKRFPEITAIAAWSLLHGYASLVIDNSRDRYVGSKGQIDMLMDEMTGLVC